MNYKIEKNTVQETLVIPLYARKQCSERFPKLFRDEAAIPRKSRGRPDENADRPGGFQSLSNSE